MTTRFDDCQLDSKGRVTSCVEYKAHIWHSGPFRLSYQIVYTNTSMIKLPKTTLFPQIQCPNAYLTGFRIVDNAI